jgi:hypothetical protein
MFFFEEKLSLQVNVVYLLAFMAYSKYQIVRVWGILPVTSAVCMAIADTAVAILLMYFLEFPVLVMELRPIWHHATNTHFMTIFYKILLSTF